MSSKIVLEGKNLTIGYPKSKNKGNDYLHRDLSFSLSTGELVCLLGSNGAGKSTLLRTISRLQPSLAGEIMLFDKPINSYSEKQMSQLLGLVLTDKTSVGGLRVREVVELGRYPYTGFFGQLTKKDQAIVEQVMSDVGITHKTDSYMSELSDGERQKVMIAKALAQECPLIILDEPTAFLDIESRIEIIELLHQLAEKHQKTILLSTHDIDVALLLADRLWLLSKSKGLVCGLTESIILSGQMDDFFETDKIVFNRETGIFLPNRKTEFKAYLSAEHDCHVWIQNLLEKHGYAVTANADENGINLRVSVVSPRVINLIFKDKTIGLQSYEQLSEWLKNNK